MKHEPAYADMIDNTTEMVRVGSLEWYPSTVLARMDPVAYRIGYDEWLDALEADGCYCSECDTMGFCGGECACPQFMVTHNKCGESDGPFTTYEEAKAHLDRVCKHDPDSAHHYFIEEVVE